MKMELLMLTHRIVRAIYDYADNGWLIRRSTGQVCGTVKLRYIHINIDDVEYLAHRLIWLWHNEDLPRYIDHIDRNGYNNRIENLRACTPSQNLGNLELNPMRGIEKHGRKWRVRISPDSGKVELGSFESLEDAMAARDAGYLKYFGGFANV